MVLGGRYMESTVKPGVKKDDKEKKSNSEETGAKIISNYALKAMEKVPDELKIFVYLSGLISLLCIILAGSFLSFERSDSLIIILMVVALIGIIIISVMAYKISKTKSFLKSPKLVSQPTWSRLLPKVPIDGKLKDDLYGQLKRIRERAHYLISNKDKSIGLNQIRINIFIPDTKNANQGEVCSLHIPKRLHSGMKDKDERSIRFRPNEGLTGRVFSYNERLGTRKEKNSKGEEEWIQVNVDSGRSITPDEEYKLTNEQLSLITDRLIWVVSFPLKIEYRGEEEVMGILNIDGLDKPISNEIMKDLANYVEKDVEALNEKLREAEMRRVIIDVQDV
jgi:hypothetical protein